MITARFMLDTNIISDVVRNPAGPAANVLQTLNSDDICISSIVLSEILFGISAVGRRGLADWSKGCWSGSTSLPMTTWLPADTPIFAPRWKPGER